MSQIEAHELVTRVEYGQKYGSVGLCARVGLHVSPFGAEYLFDSFDGQAFALVHHFASAVVAFAGVAFSIFVGQAGAHGLHHFIAHKVFGGNQFDALQLALVFFFDDLENQVVSFHLYLN